MSAADLAAAIAARTTPGGPGATRLPSEQWEVERAIRETRLEVNRQISSREHPIDGGRMTLRPGQSVGRGKKECPACHGVVASAAKRCRHCKQVFLERGERTQVALLAEASPTSSAYANNLGALRSAGLISYPGGGMITLTDTGRAAAAAPEQPPTTAELHDTLFRRLPAPQVRILKVLIDAYPAAVDRDSVADQAEASATSSAFANNLGSLRSLGLIDYPDRGQVSAKAVLFLEGR